MRVTNISPGPRFLHAQGRARLLEPGEAADLELSAAEAASVRQQVEAGVLAVAEPPASDEDGGKTKPRPERTRRPGRGE
ncbi:hypothetical protein AB4Z01_25560 [Inquilinus sp. YAF38]|uniref:hypothetical protein n=1 Tax=Inquilinus sp. YAF38 TaxID=3233084 RepID=UPI003F93D5E5